MIVPDKIQERRRHLSHIAEKTAKMIPLNAKEVAELEDLERMENESDSFLRKKQKRTGRPSSNLRSIWRGGSEREK